MTEQHPITPPRELVKEWIAEIWHDGTPVQVAQSDLHLADRATQWGADQELEACCGWLVLNGYGEAASRLRTARRQKPPSLKEQALNALSHLIDGAAYSMDTTEPAEYIRRALEALPDD